MNDVAMSSSRPYLLRALNEWIVDNQLTPYIVCNATYPDIRVPEQFIENGKIVLNIAPEAIRDLTMDNETLDFFARFSGKEMHVHVPVMAVLAIYARENGQGMVFVEEGREPPSPEQGSRKPGKPSLKLVN